MGFRGSRVQIPPSRLCREQRSAGAAWTYRRVCRSRGFGVCRGFAIGREPLGHCHSQIGLVYNVVTVEHRPCLPTAQLHDRPLVDAGTAEVPRCRSTEVVNQSARQPGPLTSAPPGLGEADDAPSVTMEDEHPIPSGPLSGEHLLQLKCQAKREDAIIVPLGLMNTALCRAAVKATSL
jgi:hypothetical protein